MCRNPAIRHLPDVANISLGFLPLNHLLGRMAIVQCMVSGGSTAFVRPSYLHARRFCPLCLTMQDGRNAGRFCVEIRITHY